MSGSGEPRSQQASASELSALKAERLGQSPERLVVGLQAEAHPVGRMGEGPHMDALPGKPLHEGRRRGVTGKAEQRRAAQDLESGSPQEIVEARAVGHHAIARRA